MSGKNAGKINIYFYHNCPANRSSKKKRLVKNGLIFCNCSGRRSGCAGGLPALFLILFHFCTGGPGGCPEKMPEKLTSAFIITARLTEAAKKEAG
jgi:hypothetical protein